MEAFLGQFSGYLPHTTQGYISLVAAVLGIISLLWLFPFRFIFTVFIMTVGVCAVIMLIIQFAIPPLPTTWALVASIFATSIIYGKYIPYGYVTVEPQKAIVYRNKYSLTRNGYIALKEGERTIMFIYEYFLEVIMSLQEAVTVGSATEQLIYTSKDGSPWTAALTLLWKVGTREVDIITFAKNNNTAAIIAAIKEVAQRKLRELLSILTAEPDGNGRMQISAEKKDWVYRTLLSSLTKGDGANELRRFGVVIDSVQLSDIDPPKIVEEEREEASGEASAIRAKLQVLKDFNVDITESIVRGVILSEGEGDGHHGGGNIVVDNISGSGGGQHQHKKSKGRHKKNRQGGGNTP